MSSQDVYFSKPGVAVVRWHEARAAVVVEWEGWATTAEFDELLDAEVRALREHKASRILADCRNQRALNMADQDRAERDWAPLAAAAGLQRFAVVLPVSDRAATQLRDRLAQGPKAAFRIAFFTSVEKAEEWLAR